MTQSWRDYNYFLLGCVIILTGFSVATVYSITISAYFTRHLVNLIVGAVAMVVFTIIDYQALRPWSKLLFILSVVVLLIVDLFGDVRGGAQSWIDLGIRTFQPSEPIKLAFVIFLAAFWAHYEEHAKSWKVQLGALILAGIPILLVFVQPDFGTAMVFVTIWLAMAWTSGMPWWQLLVLGTLFVPTAIFGWNNVLTDVQQARLLIFMDPVKYDPTLRGDAWDIVQATTAVQAGGLTGVGWDQGLITQGRLIAAMYTDFIFASVAEELGFIGATVLIIFQCLLMWQGISIARSARDMFGRLLAVGITALIFCHALVNIGMNLQLLPITGLPLPFISYGGSFTLTSFAAIGILESIALRRRRTMFG